MLLILWSEEVGPALLNARYAAEGRGRILERPCRRVH